MTEIPSDLGPMGPQGLSGGVTSRILKGLSGGVSSVQLHEFCESRNIKVIKSAQVSIVK